MRSLRTTSWWSIATDARRRLSSSGLALAVVLLACAQAAVGRTLYVDSEASGDSDGGEKAPFKTVSAMLAEARDGDTALLRGSFSEPIRIVGLDDFTMAPWPGQAKWTNSSQRKIKGFGPESDAVYPFSRLTSHPASVAEDWSIDDRRPRGHMVEAASLIECRKAAGSWWWDEESKTLYVHASDSGDPDANDHSYSIFRMGDGVVATRCERLTIRGARIAGWCGEDADGRPASGIALRSVVGAVIEDTLVIDSGAHSVVFSGARCLNNTVRKCVFQGLADSDASHVLFSVSVGAVRSCAGENLVAHCYGLLRPNGSPLHRSVRVTAYAQGADEGAVIAGVVWRHCAAIGLGGHRSSPFAIAGRTTRVPMTQRENSFAYPVRIVECKAVNCDAIGLGADVSVALVRCRLDLRRAAQTGGIEGAAIHLGSSSGGEGRVLFESCELIGKTRGPSTSLVRLDGPVELIYNGVTSYLAGAGRGSHLWMGDDSPRIHWRQSVFASKSPAGLIGGEFTHALRNGGVNIAYNWYDNISENRYCQDASHDSHEEWQVSVDLGTKNVSTFYDVSPGLQSPPRDLDAKLGSKLRITRYYLFGAWRIGINGAPYSGSFGARQYPITPDLNGDGVVDSKDLSQLIKMWGACEGGPLPCPADLDRDGGVTARDLARLVASMGADHTAQSPR